MFKNIKLLSYFFVFAIICTMLSSCQLSKLKKPQELSSEPTGSNTVPLSSDTEITSPQDEHEPMDLKKVDISMYITLGDYKNFKLETRSDEFTEKEFRDTIDNILKQNGEPAQITDRKTEKGDTLNIDFEGYLNGVQFDGGTASSRKIDLKEKTGYIPGFDADLYGVMPGTSVETKVTFPADYGNEELNGKEVIFKIKVNYIYGEIVKPEYNDAFVEKFTGGDYKTIKDFEEFYFDLLKKNKKLTVREEEKQTAWEAYLDSCAIVEVPQQQIDYYYYSERNYYEAYAAMYGITYEQMLQYNRLSDESIKKRAYESALDDVALEAVYRAENLTFTDDDYSNMLKDYAEKIGSTPEALIREYGDQTLKNYFSYDKAKSVLASYSEFTIKNNIDETESGDMTS